MLQFANSDPSYSESFTAVEDPFGSKNKTPKIGKMKIGESYGVLKSEIISKAPEGLVIIEMEIDSKRDTIFESNLPIQMGI